MNFPLMLRSDHNAIVSALKACNDSLFSTNDTLRAALSDKIKENEALSSFLTASKCNDYTLETPKKSKSGPVKPTGRGGWRARAQMLSEQTYPVPGDSVKDLEKRVAEQGGKSNV